MALTQCLTNSFKSELLKSLHNFDSAGGDSFKIALYTSSATWDYTTTVYSVTNEVSGTGYTAGGTALTNVGITNGGTNNATAYLSFNNASWPTSTITARCAMIYNTRAGANRAVAILDFGGNYTSTGGTFTVQFPTNGPTTSIIILN